MGFLLKYPMLFDALFGSINSGGLRLRVVNNGDGTATLTWSGYDLEAFDPGGTWLAEYSYDNVSWSTIGSTAVGVFTINDTHVSPDGPTYYRVSAMSGVVAVSISTLANAAVTLLAIDSAADDGSGVTFDLTISWTNPASYTHTWGTVEVVVDSLTVYGPTAQDLDAETLTLNLAGLVGDSVAVYIIVTGETSAVGTASSTVTDDDVVASSMEAEATAWIGRNTTQGWSMSGTEQTVYNDLVVAGKTTSSWWTKVSVGDLGTGVANANTVVSDRTGLGTMSGTNTYTGGATDFGTTGSLLTPIIPNTEGAFAGLGVWCDSPGQLAGTTDIGCLSSGSGIAAINLNNGTIDYEVYYLQNSLVNISPGQTVSALYIAHRHTSTTQTFDRTTSGGTTSINTSAIGSPGTLPTVAVAVGAFNNNGTVGSQSGRVYRCWLYIKTTLTAPELAALKVDMIAWLIGLGRI